jgi:hypothetical protein
MHQMWLTAIGLALDFAGFCLLLREWWIAFFQETSELERARRLAWEQSLRHHAFAHMPDAQRTHAETAARMHDQMQFQAAQRIHWSSLSSRKRVFLAASVLIVLGFALQLLGAVPGCCPPGIMPQGS